MARAGVRRERRPAICVAVLRERPRKLIKFKMMSLDCEMMLRVEVEVEVDVESIHLEELILEDWLYRMQLAGNWTE